MNYKDTSLIEVLVNGSLLILSFLFISLVTSLMTSYLSLGQFLHACVLHKVYFNTFIKEMLVILGFVALSLQGYSLPFLDIFRTVDIYGIDCYRSAQ
jgi:hypothetical protein